MATLVAPQVVGQGQQPRWIQHVGVTRPWLVGVVRAQDGSAQDMTGATVYFSMRSLLSRNPILNTVVATALAPPDADGNNVQYQWRSQDVAVEGEYMGWWSYSLPISQPIEDTPEFPITITDHGPGLGTATGVVVDGMAEYLPVTLDAMRRDPRYGDRFLQRVADRAKRFTMSSVVAPDVEATYDPALIDYLSKLAAYYLTGPAKEYWARQHRTVSTQGPSEMTSYPDMIATLDALYLRLRAELADDWRQLQFLGLSLPQRTVMPVPISSLGPAMPTTGPVTADPFAVQPAVLGGPQWGLFFP